MSFDNIDWYQFALMMAALVVCITIHEFAHAFSALRSGDETPRKQGRISLNPLDHLDPMGTVMMVVSSLAGFGIGWGKPVQVNPYNFNHPRWDNLKVSLWGPLSNLITAAVTGTVIRFAGGHMGDNVFEFVWLITLISIGLALFNLIPISPLDGSHIISSLLPYEQAKRYDHFMARNGMLLFVGLIVLGNYIFPVLLGPPRVFLVRLFTWHMF